MVRGRVCSAADFEPLPIAWCGVRLSADSNSRRMASRYLANCGVSQHLQLERLQFVVERRVVRERELLRVRFEEEIERVEHRHLRDQIHLDQELAGRFRENEPGEVVGLRILLPVDEVLLRRDAERVAQDAGAAVRRGPQPDDLRPERDGPVVAVVRPVVEGDVNGHASAKSRASSRPEWGVDRWIHWLRWSMDFLPDSGIRRAKKVS